jgi:ribonuclease E
VTDELPRASTREHAFFAAICRRIDATNELLAELLDRLPPPATAGQPAEAEAADVPEHEGSGVVALTEPATPPPAPGPAVEQVALTEPATPPSRPRAPRAKAPTKPADAQPQKADEPSVAEPAAPAKRTARKTAAKKPTAAGRRRTTKEN